MHKIIAVIVLVIIALSGLSSAAAQTEPDSSGDEPAELTGELSPSLKILVLVTLGTPILLTCFVVILVWCLRDEITFSWPGLTVMRPPKAARGIHACVVEELPSFLYVDVKSLNVGQGALECAICLSEFEDLETLRLLPKCDHVFHTQCIGAWLCTHVTCPVCRSDLTSEPVVQAITGTDTNEIESQTGEEQREPDQENGDHVNVTVEPVTRVELLRWNSTGHLWFKPVENQNTDRFTLKLPEEIRKKILELDENSRKGRRLNRRQSMSERGFVFETSSFEWSNGSVVSPKGLGLDEGTSVHVGSDVRPPV